MLEAMPNETKVYDFANFSSVNRPVENKYQFSPFYLKLRASVKEMCHTNTLLVSITKID